MVNKSDYENKQRNLLLQAKPFIDSEGITYEDLLNKGLTHELLVSVGIHPTETES